MRSASCCAAALVFVLVSCGSDREPDSDSEHEPEPATNSTPEPDPDRSPGDASEPWTVSPTTFGRIRLGTTVSDASRALGAQIDMTNYGEISESCGHVRAPTMPRRTYLMVIDSVHVARVEIDTTTIRTARGVGVGSTEQEVIDAYDGAIRTEPHAYTGPEGHYLVHLNPADTMFAIVFETDGRRVTRYRAGRQPEVMFVEGCA